MSKLVIPVTGQFLWHTGDRRLWTDTELHLKDGSGNWHRQIFRVDTATDLTTMGAHEAKQLGLPMPARPAVGAVHNQTGLEIRSGYLRFRIDGMGTAEYAITCLFLGDPDTPPAASRQAPAPRNLLQPYQLVDWLRFVIEKDAVLGWPFGELVIETV
jgi:hypothetical protein